MKGPRYMPGSCWTNIAFLQPFLKDSETIRECLRLQWKSRESGCRKLLWMPSRILITSFCQIQNAILNLLRIQTRITKTTSNNAILRMQHEPPHCIPFSGLWRGSLREQRSPRGLFRLFIQIIIFLFDRNLFQSVDRNLKANILGGSWRLIRMFGLS